MNLLYFLFLNGLFIAISDVTLQTFLGCKSRWFQLHSFINFIIVILTFGDFKMMVTDPLKGISQYCDRSASCLIFSLHLHHLVAYKKKTRMDYIHHIVSCFILGLPAILFYYNKALNLGNFFICGFPGLINYMCLTFVKHKIIDKTTEKKINAIINCYLRLPGIIFTIILNNIAYQYHYDKYTTPSMFWVGSIILFWNGTFFCYEAILNYAIHNKQALK